MKNSILVAYSKNSGCVSITPASTELRYDYRSGFDLCAECETELEWTDRVAALQVNRGMTARAATVVVDAAMFGIGCPEG